MALVMSVVSLDERCCARSPRADRAAEVSAGGARHLRSTALERQPMLVRGV